MSGRETHDAMFLAQASDAESHLNETVEECYDANEEKIEQGFEYQPRGYLRYQHDGRLSQNECQSTPRTTKAGVDLRGRAYI